MIDRRDFLSRAAATGLAAALPFELANAARIPGPTSDKWDLGWTARLKGKSRAVFDSPEVSEGAALFRAAFWRTQMNEVLGTPKEDVTPVIVFRHVGIALIMDDQYWDHFGAGKHHKLKDPATKKWTKKNPVGSAPADAKPPWNELTIPAFIANGGIVLACNLAFQEVIGEYRKKDKLSAEDAKKRALEHVIPGVILQPSGFFAVLKAQDEGCHYMLGS